MSHLIATGSVSTALLVTAGATLIGGLAGMAAGLTRSAVWQRTIWRAAVLGVFFMLALELTGTSAGLWQLLRQAVSIDKQRYRSSLPLAPGAGRGEAMQEQTAQRFLLAPALSRSERGNEAAPSASPTVPPTRLDEPAVAPDRGTESGTASALRQGFLAQLWAGAVLAVAWWLGAVGLVARTFCARILLGRFRGLQAACNDPTVRLRVESLTRRLGIRRAVEVRTSHALAAPVAFGVLRQVLVLPPAFGERFDRGEQEAILAHELAHLAAGDAIWLLLADLLAAVLWWQPVVWWVRRRLRTAGEMAADEASFLVPDGPHILAACLVALGGRLAVSGRLAWLSMAGGGFRSGLGHRVQRLLDLDRRPPRTPGRGLVRTAKVLLVLVLVIVAVACTAWARPQAIPSEGETTMNVLSHSWRHSLAAALVMACWTTAAPQVRADDQPKPEGPQAESRRGGPEDRELPPELAERLEKRRALHHEAESVLRKVMELKSGDEEQAKQLFAALKELAAKIEQLPVPPPLIAREGRQLERLAATLQAAKAKAQQFGSQEAVAWLEQASQKIRQEMELARRAGRGSGGEGREDAEHRVQHLRAAIDNLRAAGMGEMADALERELRRGLQGRPDQQAPRGDPRMFAGPGNLQQEVQQLRGEVQSLHQQLNEMRQAIQHLMSHEQNSEHKADPPRER